MLFLYPVDLNKNELRNARIQNLATAPSSPVAGQIYYGTDVNDALLWNGSIWLSLGTGGGVSDHGALTGLTDDDHSQYALLAGRSGGQVLIGGTGSGEDLFLVSTSNGTKGQIYFGPTTSAAAFVDQTTGNITGNTLISTVATGTAPLTISSTTVVANLNADKVDGQDGSYYLSRTNHTGTQTASTISDFDTQVRTSRLDQMAAPTASVSLSSQKITNLADGTSAGDAINLGQLQSASLGLAWKDNVRVATTVAGTLATSFENGDTVDGITLATGDRILIKDQGTASENGIYVVAASGAPTRATDADSASELRGAVVVVEEGTANADQIWQLITDSITLGTTGLTWQRLPGPQDIVAGAGLTKTSNTLDVGTASTSRIVVNADNIDLATVGTAGTYYGSVTTDAYGRVSSASTDLVSGNGLVVRTSSTNYTNRTVTGTSNRVTVTNGDGVSGNPTLDISSSYVGQATITTLGTITTGVWTGTNIAVANGGTGSGTAAGARTNLGATGKYTALIGDNSSTTITITQATHGLASDGSMVAAIYDASSGDQVQTLITINNGTGAVSFKFNTAPTTNQYRIVIIG
jgi:hypothetical protein